MAMPDKVNVRFRTNDIGDIGPIEFEKGVLAQSMKARLFDEWPKEAMPDYRFVEGPVAERNVTKPTSRNDFRLILGGRSMEPSDTLWDPSYVQLVGEIRSDTIITIHVVVRPNSTAQRPGKVMHEIEQSAGCGCCIQ